MAHSVEHLATLMDQLVTLLRHHNEEHWADWVEADARAVRARDGWGLEHFLAAFGAGGSLWDLVFHPVNGNAESDTEGRAATEQLHELLEEAYPIAQDMVHELHSADEDDEADEAESAYS